MPEEIANAHVKVIEQAYLSVNPVVRIRKSNNRYILTYKSHDNIDVNDSKSEKGIKSITVQNIKKEAPFMEEEI